MDSTNTVPKYLGQTAKLLLGRFKWVKWLFYATALGNLIMLIGSALIFTQDFSVYDAEVDFSSADWFLIAGGVLYTLAFIGSIIAFSMFSFRAMKNLHIWGHALLKWRLDGPSGGILFHSQIYGNPSRR